MKRVPTKKLTISIDTKDLSLERTIFQILSKKEGVIKEKVKLYLEWLKKEYPSTKDEIETMWNKEATQTEWKSYTNTTIRATWLTFIRFFTFDDTIIENVKKDAKEKLKLLFSSSNTSDNDIKKDLKSQSIEGLINDFENDYKADQIAWAVELCRNFYLERLPQYIEENLKSKNLVPTLDEFDKESWKKIREKLFTDLYLSWKKTSEESEINNLEKTLGEDIFELNDLIDKSQKAIADKLTKAKDRAKKESSDGTPWDLTQEEKEKIDGAKNQQELDNIVANLKNERETIGPKDLATAEKWIDENISKKTKLEDLPTEEDIEKALGSLKLPVGFKEKARQTLRKKRRELTPKPTTIQGKIKELLVWFQKRVGNLEKGIGGEAEIQEFKEYSKVKIDKVMPLVNKALEIDTLEGYKELDKKWGEDKIDKDGKVIYDFERDYFGVWKTLQSHLEEEERVAKETEYKNLEKWAREELGKDLSEQFIEFKVEVKK